MRRRRMFAELRRRSSAVVAAPRPDVRVSQTTARAGASTRCESHESARRIRNVPAPLESVLRREEQCRGNTERRSPLCFAPAPTGAIRSPVPKRRRPRPPTRARPPDGLRPSGEERSADAARAPHDTSPSRPVGVLRARRGVHAERSRRRTDPATATDVRSPAARDALRRRACDRTCSPCASAPLHRANRTRRR